MTSEPNTDILEIDPNQYGKAASANTAFSAIDSMLGGTLSVDASAHATPYTIPYNSGVDEPLGSKTALRFFKLTVTGALGADWVAYMPAAKQKFFIVKNSTTGGHNITIKVSGQTGVTLGPNAEAFCFLNGTDVELILLLTPPLCTFATLPASPAVGQLAQISDCNTSTFGATAAGSGTTNVMVRWNGSNWTVCGV